ncbi:hypothetical protein [Plantactinospora sp. CA-290183]|uniref:hypothetical protein n=1 Tax=Plantactinospora sp. CA-290183 TaxID=3240006 RepID=UPI003D8B66EC
MAVSGWPGNRSFLVPLVALASTLVVLVVAIVVVLASRRDEPTGGAACLTGSWAVTSHRERVDVPDAGRLEFTGGTGATMSWNAEGQAVTDYRTGTFYRSAHAGQEVVLELRGTVEYRYRLTAERIELPDVRSHATVRLRVGDGTAGPWRNFTPSTEPLGYVCAGDTLTVESLLFTTGYARLR